MGLVSELRRRNVFRMGVLYVVAAWLIMQVAGVLMDLGALPVTIGPWALVVLVIGFPIALVFSWLVEITPEGLALEKDVPEGASITHITGRRMDFIAISILSAAVVLFAWDKWWIGPPPETSIAVLPFENLSGDPEQEYFSDGISEEILNVLAGVPDLQVAARTSSFAFSGQQHDLRAIGDILNVAHILNGSVRKSGNRLRITTELIKVKEGYHLWSDSYDREMTDVFAIQDEISAAVVAALKEHFGLQAETAPRTITAVNTEAHDAYLRGRYLVFQRGGAVARAVREFEKAITLNPDYALAHAELAITNLLLRRGDGSYGDLTSSEAAARAAPHVKRAMALDPTLAEAHAAAGFLSWVQQNRQEALRHFKRAIQIKPSYSNVYIWMHKLYHEIGNYKESFAMSEVAVKLDPLSSSASYNHLIGLIDRGRLDEAALQVEKIISMRPDLSVFHHRMLSSLGGNWADYIIGRLDAWSHYPRHPVSPIRLAWQFALIGLEQEALTVSEPVQPHVLRILGRPGDAVKTAEARLAEDPELPSARIALGMALASAGDYERARPILEEYWEWSSGRVGPLLSIFDIAPALIIMRRNAGEEGKIGELLSALRNDVRRQREAGLGTDSLHFAYSIDYESGLADFLSGEHDQGLKLIARAVEDGFFILPNEAYLQVLYSDPGFAPIRAMQVARQNRERTRLLAIVCNDNPYETVWRPAEGTCEQFMAARGN